MGSFPHGHAGKRPVRLLQSCIRFEWRLSCAKPWGCQAAPLPAKTDVFLFYFSFFGFLFSFFLKEKLQLSLSSSHTVPQVFTRARLIAVDRDRTGISSLRGRRGTQRRLSAEVAFLFLFSRSLSLSLWVELFTMWESSSSGSLFLLPLSLPPSLPSSLPLLPLFIYSAAFI